MGQRFNRPGSNLATIARETGYPVIEVPGWSHHDHGAFANHVGAIVCHHTAGPEPERTASNYPSLNVVRNGRSDLPGPLSNYGIGYDGTIYVISAGTCWHAGRGGWAGMSANSQAIGIEAEDGGDGDWTREQLDVYPRLCAVICQFLAVTAAAVCGHKEWCSPPGRKPDPAGIDMRAFRKQVDHYLHNPHEIRRGHGSAPPAAPEEDEDMTPEQDAMLRRIEHELLGPRGDEGQITGWGTDVGPRTVVAMLVELTNALVAPEPSRVPGAEHIMVPAHDAIRDTNGVVYTLPALINAAGKADPADIAEALRPMLSEVVGPVVAGAVSDAVGGDNAEQAEAIVSALAARLAGTGVPS